LPTFGLCSHLYYCYSLGYGDCAVLCRLSAFQVLCCVLAFAFAFATLSFHSLGFVAYLLPFITITFPDLCSPRFDVVVLLLSTF